MSFLDLAKFLQTTTVKNADLQVGIGELEDEIKKNLQLQQAELIHLEEKYHNLMKTHILNMMEKRGEKHKKNEILRKKLVDAYKKSADMCAQMQQSNVQTVTNDSSEPSELLNQPQQEIKILKELQQKKKDMYKALEKRSIVEKLKRTFNNKPEALIKQNQARERVKARRSMTRQNLKLARQIHNDAVLSLFQHDQKLDDADRRVLGNTIVNDKNDEPSEFAKQQHTKEQRFPNTFKGICHKTRLPFKSFMANDLPKFDTNGGQTIQKFKVEPQKHLIEYPLNKIEERHIICRQKLDKLKTTTRRVHFKEPDNSFKTLFPLTHNLDTVPEDSVNSFDEEYSNIQNESKCDAKEITYQENLDLPKNLSYTILPNLKKESDIKTENNYSKQQATTSGIVKSSATSTTGKFKKKKKLLLDFEGSKLPSIKSTADNYSKEESILSEAITNKKIDAYNDFLNTEQDRASYKKNNWNFNTNSDSDTSSSDTSTAEKSLNFCCTKFFSHK